MPDPTQTITETPEEKYARLYANPPIPSNPPATPPVAETTPPAATIPPEFVSMIEGLRQEIASLKPQAPPPPPPGPPPNPNEWIEKIRAGDYDGAQKLIIEATKRGMQDEIQQVLTNANAQTQVQIEMDRYLNQVRGQNPDLIAFETYLEAPIARRVDAARAAGKIKSHSDFVKEYKSAVDEEVKALRNLSLQFRAAGKEEATTRTREVLSSSPLHPQQVQSTQTPPAEVPQAESTEEYFARRKADEMRRRGLT